MSVSFAMAEDETTVSIESSLSRISRRILRTVFDHIENRATKLHVYFQMLDGQASIGILYEIDGKVLEFSELSQVTPPLTAGTDQETLNQLGGNLGIGLHEMMHMFASSKMPLPTEVWMSIDVESEESSTTVKYPIGGVVELPKLNAAIKMWKNSLASGTSTMNGDDLLMAPLDLQD